MIRPLLFTFILLSSTLSFASERCTVDHVKEAMELNRTRRELYRADGNHKAARILNKLILLEKFMLAPSKKLDQMTEQLQEAGVAMWCDDLVSMSDVPAYQTQTEPPQNKFQAWPKKKRKALTRKLHDFKFNDHHKMYREISEVIYKDLSDLHYNCLTRHFLEAMARNLLNAPKHLAAAPLHLKEQVIESVEAVIGQSARALSYAVLIDKMAAREQSKGIPVLCQEMPPIPWQ